MSRRPSIVRATIGLAFAVALGIGLALGAFAGAASPSLRPSRSTSDVATASGSPPPSASAPPTAGAAPTPAATAPSQNASPTPGPTPTPRPTPVLMPAPLTGLPVSPGAAQRHVIAVMVDDHWDARPQSGFTDASIVWQAPAEGGIPRYMMLFQERLATSVGPVRSARYYFVVWAAEWDALYVHVGGSPQALALLHSADGTGRVVFDADEYRWGGRAGYLWRATDRFPPHNVYSDGAHLRQLARRVGARDREIRPAWRFGPDAEPFARPLGGRLIVPYQFNRIVYEYDRRTNTYLRSVSDQGKQIDRATGMRVAPKNVVVLMVRFGPLNDGSKKHRLEAQLIGSGRAYIATNGHTISGTWKKASLTGPTLLFGPDGKPVTLTRGQTFVQVVPTGTKLTIKDGKVPPQPSRPDPRSTRNLR